MSRQVLLRRGYVTWFQSSVLLTVAVLLVGLTLGGCKPASNQVEDDAQAEESSFDVAQLSWDPQKVSGVAPGLVGWRSPGDGEAGALVSLQSDTAGAVLWQPSFHGADRVRLLDIDPSGLRMIGEAVSNVTGVGLRTQTLLFSEDGSVTELRLPEGFEGVADATFIGNEVLAVAYHATTDNFETTLGIVSAAGEWTTLELRGDLPQYHFVEACLVRPNSDTVALVLKVPGGTGDRDDDLLVLAQRSGTVLDIVSTPFPDDSLPGAQPLWTADGVVFPRLWNMVDGAFAPVLVRAEWTGGAWVESELTSPEAIPLGPEMGEVVAQDASGTYWLRSSNDQHGAASTLLTLPSGASSPEPVGVSLDGISWFTWIEADKG